MTLAARIARGLGAPLRVLADHRGDPGGDVPRLERCDAIVALGAPLSPGGTIGEALGERIAAAAALWHAGGAPRVVVTGGDTGGSGAGSGCGGAARNEADAMAEALIAAGVPAPAIVRERAARSTDDNARFTAALLAPLGARTVWVVTQPFHGRRARRCFRRAGLDARVWPIADSVEYRRPRRALRWIAREYAAWLRELAR